MERMLVVQERNGEAQDARVARAIAEAPDYDWTKSPIGWVVVTRSGGCYQVDEKGACSCEGHRRNCAGTETRCKHVVALRMKLLAETAPAPPAPTETPKGLPLMTDAEVARWDRLWA